MLLLAAILAATLTRAEIVERFRAAPVVMCDGLVQVWARCPPDMRREYQTPVAGYVADVCRALYSSQNIRTRRFEKPGIVVTIGDVVTNDSSVIARVVSRGDGSSYVRVLMPAPGFADTGQLRLAAARGWSLAVRGFDLDEGAARDLLTDSDPDARIAAELEDLVAWRTQGVYRRGRGDEDYLKLQRKILRPGFASREEVLTFASRLILYPACQACPFKGLYDQLEFRDALLVAKDDLDVRIAALRKSDELIVWGGGRGESLDAAARAYFGFLRALASGKDDVQTLGRMLAEADLKLKEALP